MFLTIGECHDLTWVLHNPCHNWNSHLLALLTAWLVSRWGSLNFFHNTYRWTTVISALDPRRNSFHSHEYTCSRMRWHCEKPHPPTRSYCWWRTRQTFLQKGGVKSPLKMWPHPKRKTVGDHMILRWEVLYGTLRLNVTSVLGGTAWLSSPGRNDIIIYIWDMAARGRSTVQWGLYHWLEKPAAAIRPYLPRTNRLRFCCRWRKFPFCRRGAGQ
jgi:hypothetical protein